MKKLLASLAVLGGAACYGLLAPVVKLAYMDGYTAHEVTSSQFFIAFFLASLVILWKWKTGMKVRIRPKEALQLLAVGGIGLGGTSIFYYHSLTLLPASMSVILLFQFTLVVFLFDFLFHRRLPSSSGWMSICLVMMGTYLAVGKNETVLSQGLLWGWVWGLLAAVTYAVMLYFTGEVAPYIPSVGRTWMMLAGGSLVVFLFFPPVFLWDGRMWEGLWRWALFTGLLGQMLPTYLFAWGIPDIGGTLAAILGSVELPVSLSASRVILAEPIRVGQWAGMLFILAGIVVSEIASYHTGAGRAEETLAKVRPEIAWRENARRGRIKQEHSEHTGVERAAAEAENAGEDPERSD